MSLKCLDIIKNRKSNKMRKCLEIMLCGTSSALIYVNMTVSYVLQFVYVTAFEAASSFVFYNIILHNKKAFMRNDFV